jgi:hypothetical protein
MDSQRNSNRLANAAASLGWSVVGVAIGWMLAATIWLSYPKSRDADLIFPLIVDGAFLVAICYRVRPLTYLVACILAFHAAGAVTVCATGTIDISPRTPAFVSFDYHFAVFPASSLALGGILGVLLASIVYTQRGP